MEPATPSPQFFCSRFAVRSVERATMQTEASPTGRRLQKSGLLCLRRRDASELLHQLIQLRDVVVDVLVAIFRIEITGEFGSFVGCDLFRRGFDVVADLLAGFVGAAADERELVGS